MNRETLIGLLCFFFSLQLTGQSIKKEFSTLSSPEKWWVIWHPFKAKKALEVSVRTLSITDSIKRTGTIGVDINGGKLDAFKHCLWMVALSHRIGERAALKLGHAHEKGNYHSFLKGNLEDGNLPDKVSSDMDLFNNKIGAKQSSYYSISTEKEFIDLTLELLDQGALRIIKKEGNVFLNCQGEKIPEASLLGTWENSKCLVPSNQP